MGDVHRFLILAFVLAATMATSPLVAQEASQRTCRLAVFDTLGTADFYQVETDVVSSDARGDRVSWTTTQGKSGTCLVSAKGALIGFTVGATTTVTPRPPTTPIPPTKPVPLPQPDRSTSIRCESNEGRRSECAIPRGSEVRLVQVLSEAPCREGRSWGHDDRRIWVTEGCRAEFEVRPFVVRPDREELVEETLKGADGEARAACRDKVRDRYPSLRASQVTTAVASRAGKGIVVVDWRTRRGDSGLCRVNRQGKVVQFDVHRADRSDRDKAAPRRLTCASNDERRAECAIPRGSEVRLVRVLSQARCTEGRTWGHDDRHIWVTEGCRAEFEVETR